MLVLVPKKDCGGLQIIGAGERECEILIRSLMTSDDGPGRIPVRAAETEHHAEQD